MYFIIGGDRFTVSFLSYPREDVRLVTTVDHLRGHEASTVILLSGWSNTLALQDRERIIAELFVLQSQGWEIRHEERPQFFQDWGAFTDQYEQMIANLRIGSGGTAHNAYTIRAEDIRAGSITTGTITIDNATSGDWVWENYSNYLTR